jgi:excisionase family DNA binding protein
MPTDPAVLVAAEEARQARLDRLAAQTTLTLSEAAELCGVNRTTMAGWLAAGLPVFQPPGGRVRISTAALLAWIEANTAPLTEAVA